MPKCYNNIRRSSNVFFDDKIRVKSNANGYNNTDNKNNYLDQFIVFNNVKF